MFELVVTLLCRWTGPQARSRFKHNFLIQRHFSFLRAEERGLSCKHSRAQSLSAESFGGNSAPGEPATPSLSKDASLNTHRQFRLGSTSWGGRNKSPGCVHGPGESFLPSVEVIGSRPTSQPVAPVSPLNDHRIRSLVVSHVSEWGNPPSYSGADKRGGSSFFAPPSVPSPQRNLRAPKLNNNRSDYCRNTTRVTLGGRVSL